MKYNIAEQALAFDRVLPWEGQVPACEIRPDGRAFLRLAAPEARTVAVVISDEEYPCTRREDGVWEMELPFQTGHHYVQLKLDGAEVLTPLLPISYGYSRPYNYVELPATAYAGEKRKDSHIRKAEYAESGSSDSSTDPRAEGCPEVSGDDFWHIKDVPHGSVRREYFYSSVTEEWESCIVYTPADYEKQPDKTFPVLYLQHGHGENETSWTTAGKVQFILDNLFAEKKAVPFAVVMCNGMVQTVTKDGRRIVDFMLLEKQLLTDVIPFVEQKLRIGGSKERRAMAGLSMGSLQTSIIGFNHPEYFSALGIFSGFVTDMMQGTELDMVDRGPGSNEHLRILEDADAFARTFPVYFRAIGDEDPYRHFFDADDKMLEEHGITHTRRIYHGIHDWNVWRQCIRDFAQLIFR